jgi:RES domain-containing protein
VSTLRIWRICPTSYAAEAFGGQGGLHYSARWHNKGRRIVYTAESRSLAALEVLANVLERQVLSTEPWVLIWVDVPSSLIEVPSRYPDDWRALPPPDSTRAFGDAWLESARSPALRVPSAVTLGEFNYLLNPRHPAFAELRFGTPEPFSFDPRLAASPAPPARRA